MKIIKALLVILGIVLIVCTVSIKLFPEWLAIPGGLLILAGLAFNTILAIGDQINGWVNLLFPEKEKDNTSKAQNSYRDISQQGGTNVVAANIENFNVYNSSDPVNSNPELEEKIFQEISFACHTWKNFYMTISPEVFLKSGKKQYLDIWEKIIQVPVHDYSYETWKKFVPLFDDAIILVIRELDSITQSHSASLPADIKVLIIETKGQLQAERTVYSQLPKLVETTEKNKLRFHKRFAEVAKVLAKLDRNVREQKKINNELEGKKKEIPEIMAGFLNEKGNIVSSITIQLERSYPKPNFVNLINEKRTKLLHKWEVEKDKYKYLDQESDDSDLPSMVSRYADRQTKAAIKNYPSRVEKFLRKYDIYQKKLYANQIFNKNYIRANFGVLNESQPTANNVIIKLFIPDNFPFPPQYIESLARVKGLNLKLLANKIEIPEVNEPEEPKITSEDYNDPLNPDRAESEQLNTGDLEISIKGGKRVIQYNLDKLISKFTYEDFPPFIMWLGNIESTKTLIIPIEIFGENLSPSPIKYNLEIKLIVK